MPVALQVNGSPVQGNDETSSLLAFLRDELGICSVKDGCSPQGQCGCCTVLVDGEPRVACVTPLRRMAGRHITTIEGLPPETSTRWSEAFAATGASQCGFCSPGIILRLVAEAAKAAPQPTQALLAHLCRCTGWLPILDAFEQVVEVAVAVAAPASSRPARDLPGARRRAELEGHVRQRIGAEVALGQGPFADDEAPADALVAVPDGEGGWVVGENLAEARRLAGKVQGRRNTRTPAPPVSVPEGSWDLVLQTSWVEPAYLETDASWCVPGGEPASPAGNGGAFGAKTSSPVAAAARMLADRHGRAVRVLYSREDSVRFGPKRAPLAAGIDRARGRVVIHVARTAGIAERLLAGLGHGGNPLVSDLDVEIHEVDVAGPPTSLAPRGAGWAEGVVLRAGLLGATEAVTQPGGGRARVGLVEGVFHVDVDAGDPLDTVVLRSYCVGAVHMGASWVSSEMLGVDTDGTVLDLTVRSFGVLRACDMAPVDLRVWPNGDVGNVYSASTLPLPRTDPLAVSDAVFAATAAAVWAAQGWPGVWPTRLGLR